MSRLFTAAALAVLIAQPALAGGISFDLPNLTFPGGDVTISTANCDGTVAQPVCTPTKN
jgi:hypothetical protein